MPGKKRQIAADEESAEARAHDIGRPRMRREAPMPGRRNTDTRQGSPGLE